MHNAEVNTTTRWNEFCRKVAKDGRVCNLYSDHIGKHKPNNGLEADRWEDEDE